MGPQTLFWPPKTHSDLRNHTNHKEYIVLGFVYTGSFLLIDILQEARKAIFLNQNLGSEAFLLPKLNKFLFQHFKHSIFLETYAPKLPI